MNIQVREQSCFKTSSKHVPNHKTCRHFYFFVLDATGLRHVLSQLVILATTWYHNGLLIVGFHQSTLYPIIPKLENIVPT